MTTVTCDSLRTRWNDPNSRPLFKGSLIDESGCCCAQGDVLRLCGMSDDNLRQMSQERADREVADKLGISLFHSILLRKVNDSQDGCPANVLLFTNAGLGSVLGPSWRSVIAFGEHMSKMTDAQWAAAWDAARDAARAAAWAAARAAAGAAAGDAAAAWAAAGAAAGDAAGAAAWAAAGELVGWTKMTTEPYFLKFFGITDAKAWVTEQEKRWPEVLP